MALGRRGRCDCRFLQKLLKNEFEAAAPLVVEVEKRPARAALLTVRYGHHFCLADDEWGVNDGRSRKGQFLCLNDYGREHATPSVIRAVELDARHDSSYVPVVER